MQKSYGFVQACSMKLWIRESCVIALPVNILMGVVCRLLGPHYTLLCVLDYAGVRAVLDYCSNTNSSVCMCVRSPREPLQKLYVRMINV